MTAQIRPFPTDDDPTPTPPAAALAVPDTFLSLDPDHPTRRSTLRAAPPPPSIAWSTLRPLAPEDDPWRFAGHFMVRIAA